MDILAFCPPDKLIPFSPISVKSPASNISKSGFNSDNSITLLYFSSSYG